MRPFESRVSRSRRKFLRVCSMTLVAAACGDGTAPFRPPSAVSYVEVTPAAATVVMGQTLQLTAKVRDSAGSELLDRPVTWRSNAETRATVSAAGLVQALALSDTVLITATSEGKSASARLVVVTDLTGEWNFTEHITGVVTCDDTGSYRFTQTRGDIGGSSAQIGTCIGGGYSSSDNTDFDDSVSGGRLSSAHINFAVGSNCAYEGTVITQPTPKLSGTLACLPDFTGTWAATPGGAPVAAVAVRWAPPWRSPRSWWRPWPAGSRTSPPGRCSPPAPSTWSTGCWSASRAGSPTPSRRPNAWWGWPRHSSRRRVGAHHRDQRGHEWDGERHG